MGAKPGNHHGRVGAFYENQRKAHLEGAGWTVTRSSLSRGPWDLWAYHPTFGHVLIQVKRATSNSTASSGRSQVKRELLKFDPILRMRVTDAIPLETLIQVHIRRNVVDGGWQVWTWLRDEEHWKLESDEVARRYYGGEEEDGD